MWLLIKLIISVFMYDFNQFANPSYLCRLAWEAVISVFNSSSTLAAQRCLIYYLWINNNWNRKCIQHRYLVSGQMSNFTWRRRWCQNIEMLIGKRRTKASHYDKKKKKYKCHFFNACNQINYVAAWSLAVIEKMPHSTLSHQDIGF